MICGSFLEPNLTIRQWDVSVYVQYNIQERTWHSWFNKKSNMRISFRCLWGWFGAHCEPPNECSFCSIFAKGKPSSSCDIIPVRKCPSAWFIMSQWVQHHRIYTTSKRRVVGVPRALYIRVSVLINVIICRIPNNHAAYEIPWILTEMWKHSLGIH